MNSQESVQTAKLPALQSLQDASFDTAYVQRAGMSVADMDKAAQDAGHLRAIAAAVGGADGGHLNAIANALSPATKLVLDAHTTQESEEAAREARKQARKAKKAAILARAAATPITTPARAHVGAGKAGKGGVYYYTEALALSILRLVEQAVPVADYELFTGGQRSAGIGSRVGVPSHIIQEWLRNKGRVRKGDEHLRVDGKFQVEGTEFSQSFARAREVAADHLADRMLALADHAVQHPGASNAARVAADILRWQAVVRYRTRYGETDEAKRVVPIAIISIGSHTPAAPKLVGSGSIPAQIEHSQPQAGRIIPGESATRVPRPTDAGSVRRGTVTVQATSTTPSQAGPAPEAGKGAPLGA